MKFVFKLILYVALLLAAVWCFGQFRSAYRKGAVLGPAELTAGESASTADAATNEVAAGVRGGAATNAAAGLTNAPVNPVAGVAATNGVAPGVTEAAKPRTNNSSSVVFLGLFIASLLAVAGLGAWDFSQYLGERAERAMMAADFEIPTDPDYEAAEAEWAKGNHLDAINLMRGYLGRNPNEQHVAIRIAEIYEKDLHNFLAAALELEEVLTKKLPREKWGWTAIRLANLYSGKLNQPPKALAWLERIVADYPDTGAAKKARQRLGIPEPETAVGEPAVTPEPAVETPPPDEPPSNLPKGFRSKK
jgi:tetratricopeptide (TPR) repeat protein